MKKLSDYVTIGEDGKPVFDNEAFQADIDRERNTASETARSNAEKQMYKNIEKEVRQKIEEEAKLTAEQKLEQERQIFETERKAFNAERIKAVYLDDNLFSKEEVEAYSPLITGNYEESLAIAQKIVEARKKRNEAYEKEFKEKMQMGQPRNEGNGEGSQGESEIAKLAKSYAPVKQEEVKLT